MKKGRGEKWLTYLIKREKTDVLGKTEAHLRGFDLTEGRNEVVAKTIEGVVWVGIKKEGGTVVH